MEYDRRVVPLFRHHREGGGEVPVSAGSVALAGRPAPPAGPAARPGLAPVPEPASQAEPAPSPQAAAVAVASPVGTPWFPIDPESDTQPIPAIRLPAMPAVPAVPAAAPGALSPLRAGLLVIAALAVAVALTLAVAAAVCGHSATAGANGPASGRPIQAGPAGPAARA
jgi:hypothetical protein